MGPRIYMGLFLSMSGLILSLSHLSLGFHVPEGDFEPFTSYGIYLYSFSPPPTTINTITTAAPSSPHLHIIINDNIIVSNTSMIDPAALESIVAAEGIASVIAAAAAVLPNPDVTSVVGTAAGSIPTNNPAGVASASNPTENPVGAAAVGNISANDSIAAVDPPALPVFDFGMMNHNLDAPPPANPVIAPVPDNRVNVLQYEIEGIHDVEDHVHRHAVAFYNVIIPLFEAAGNTFKLIDHTKYYMVMGALTRAGGGERLASLRHEFPQIHNWNKIYAIVASGDSNILVSRPRNMAVEEIVDAEFVKRITYLERVFSDLVVEHGTDHSKGRTLYTRVCAVISNVPRELCQHFTDTCPRCIERSQRTRSTAGLRPIITSGFNTRGQVDLIDFQSMPDGEFRFLLNYIDHGCKFLFSIPIVRKRASCIAVALFQIFTLIGPPMILQSDNGSEFHGAALNAR